MKHETVGYSSKRISSREGFRSFIHRAFTLIVFIAWIVMLGKQQSKQPCLVCHFYCNKTRPAS